MPTIMHFEIPADDVSRAKSFYAKLFGWKIEEIPGTDYWLITTSGEKPVGGGMMKRQTPQQTVVNYIESAAGVVAGGRTGVASVVTGLLFLAALFVAPVFGVIPAAATAPALIIVGCLMISHISEINWSDPVIAVPAFLTMTAIPLTFSIANGIAFGFTAYTLLKVLRGEFRKVNWLVYVLTALFIARFLYLSPA